MIENGQKYLITTDGWFFAPDGFQYSAAWGTCEIITTEEAFNFKPTRPSTNWFVRVGKGENSIIIAGCQIHYALKTETKPTIRTGSYISNERQLLNNTIHIAEEE